MFASELRLCVSAHSIASIPPHLPRSLSLPFCPDAESCCTLLFRWPSTQPPPHRLNPRQGSPSSTMHSRSGGRYETEKKKRERPHTHTHIRAGEPLPSPSPPRPVVDLHTRHHSSGMLWCTTSSYTVLRLGKHGRELPMSLRPFEMKFPLSSSTSIRERRC